MEPESLTFKAIQVEHPIGEFYLTALPADLLLDVAYSDVFTDLGGTFVGLERRLDVKRVAEINRYVNTRDAVFPSTIILAANCPPRNEKCDESDLRNWRIEASNDSDNIVNLVIPSRVPFATIVDGQHRLNGFRGLTGSAAQIKLPCAIFIGLPTPQQATIFATINYNQKPVNKSLTYTLFGCSVEQEDPIEWTPEKMAVYTSRCLNARDDSPFKDHIKVAALDGRLLSDVSVQRSQQWVVSTATIVEGVLSLITKNAKADRDRMYARKLFKGRRTDLDLGSEQDTPLRSYFLTGKSDAIIYDIIRNFFNAVKTLFWNEEGGSVSVLQKTAGVQALFYVLKKSLPAMLRERDVSYARFKSLLGEASHIPFGEPVFMETSGKGRSHIQDAILVALRLKQLDGVRDVKFREYLQSKVLRG